MNATALQPILILRTVSIEKLSPVLDLCQDKWPGHPLYVATSENRVGELKTDPRIENVFPYQHDWADLKESSLIEENIHCVVIPIGNQRGSGYANVFESALALPTSHISLAPYCQSLLSISSKNMLIKCKLEQILAKVCAPLSIFITNQILKSLP